MNKINKLFMTLIIIMISLFFSGIAIAVPNITVTPDPSTLKSLPETISISIDEPGEIFYALNSADYVPYNGAITITENYSWLYIKVVDSAGNENYYCYNIDTTPTGFDQAKEGFPVNNNLIIYNKYDSYNGQDNAYFYYVGNNTTAMITGSTNKLENLYAIGDYAVGTQRLEWWESNNDQEINLLYIPTGTITTIGKGKNVYKPHTDGKDVVWLSRDDVKGKYEIYQYNIESKNLKLIYTANTNEVFIHYVSVKDGTIIWQVQNWNTDKRILMAYSISKVEEPYILWNNPSNYYFTNYNYLENGLIYTRFEDPASENGINQVGIINPINGILKPLTNNDVYKYNMSVDNGRVVYEGWDGKVYYFDNNGERILIEGSNPHIYKNLVVYTNRRGELNYVLLSQSDSQPPTSTALLSGTEGQNGWYTSNVEVILTAVDNEGGSGVAKTEYSLDGITWSTFTKPININLEGNNKIYYRSVDNAGNAEETKEISLKIDKTAPVINITAPEEGKAYLLNETVNAQWSTNDQLSGIASQTGDVNSGNQIDTSTVGEKTFTVTAVDNAGNKVNKTISYKVIYAFSGVLQPLDNNGTSIFKAGSTAPVKFKLKDAKRSVISNAVAKLYLTPMINGNVGQEVEAVSAGTSNTGNQFRYDDTDNIYIFNLKTKGLALGTWQLRISLDDGTSKYITIILK